MEFSNAFQVLDGLEEKEQRKRNREQALLEFQEYNRNRVDFEFNGKLYSRAGIIPMMSSDDAKRVCSLLEELNHRNQSNPDCKEAYFIFRQDVAKHFRDWGEFIPNRVLKALERFNWNHLIPEHKHLMQRIIRPNKILKDFLDYFWSFIPRTQYHHQKKWQSIISIEAITSDAYKQSGGYWKENNYSFFCGKTDIRKDKTIFKTATREAREEGKIKFSREIFNTKYQRNIRQKYNLTNLPIGIDIRFNKVMNRHTKIIVLFMEDIDMEMRQDKDGGYLYIYLKQNYN